MKISNLRWYVVGLVALAAVINYIDRNALGVLWPFMGSDIYPGKNEDELKAVLSTVTTVFLVCYACGQAIFGKIFDWIGTRMGFVLSIGVWSIATALHAFAKGVLSFSIFRGLLGVSEAGNWPGAAKANAEWFPSKERAFAQGIFNSGAAIGGLISIPLVAWMTEFMTWQQVFIVIGLAGLLWLIPWMVLVKAPPSKHPMITEEEKEYILTGQKIEDVDGDGQGDEGYVPSYGEMLSRKESWGVIIATAAIDPIWWLFVAWIPTYLVEVYNFSLQDIKSYGWIPYVGAMFGAWFGGLLAGKFIKSGWSVNKTRKVVIVLGCLIMLPAFFMLIKPGGSLAAVLIMGVILFGFQTSIGSIQTLPSDMLGKGAVGSLSGFSGMAAKFAAAGLTFLVPWLTTGGNYAPAFIVGAALALIVMFSVLFLCPKIEPLKPKS